MESFEATYQMQRFTRGTDLDSVLRDCGGNLSPGIAGAGAPATSESRLEGASAVPADRQRVVSLFDRIAQVFFFELPEDRQSCLVAVETSQKGRARGADESSLVEEDERRDLMVAGEVEGVGGVGRSDPSGAGGVADEIVFADEYRDPPLGEGEVNLTPLDLGGSASTHEFGETVATRVREIVAA